MVLPNVWGQGQLFAFSALDGKTDFQSDFVGTLSGDRISILFHTKCVRELKFLNINKFHPNFKAVTGDYISIDVCSDNTLDIIYADTNLIIGSIPDGIIPTAAVDGEYTEILDSGVRVTDTNDGDFTGLKVENNKFAFAYAGSVTQVIERTLYGMELDVTKQRNKKLEFYKKHGLNGTNSYAKLYAKCLSTMKTQVYSPDCIFKQRWSTPDRLPHKYLWLWDSVFHSVGFRNIDTKLAQELILSIFDTQDSNGFIPHLAGADFKSDITQPCVIAWGAYLVYEKSGDKEFLKAVFDKNQKYLQWCRDNRRDTQEELYTWKTDDDANCRCGESGMDNSPRFDTKGRLQAIDYSCYMANDVRYMKKIALLLGDFSGAQHYGKWYESIKRDINLKLWDAKDGFYYDYDITNGKLHKVASVASFLPLFAGVCDETQAQRLYKHLADEQSFNTEFPIPSISKKDATFGTDMWRGPVWINYNYMIIEGLKEFGFFDLANEITDKTVRIINVWYERKGTLYEFYDCENRKAPSELNRKGAPFEPYDFKVRYQSIRDYGWSNTLLLDILHQKIDCEQKNNMI